jgi:alpha-amylase
MYNNFQQFSVVHPQWIKKSTIYEVHIRQYTKSGTILEFCKHIPRLKKLGVEILWLMPIQPLGLENRKGTMGSPYAVRDYVTVNPDFGTLEDLKYLIKMAHDSGMYVILDWVANHTAWDHTWIKQHPEFYCKDQNGNIVHPANTDWFDVADLNYESSALRQNMLEALKYWVIEVDIDGYRCDMAHLVDTSFWEEARFELDKIKSVFMLAESENQDLLYKAFDANYNWPLLHFMNDLARNNRTVKNLDDFFIYDKMNYPLNAFRMNFTSNHDENKNAGPALERLGNAFNALTVLTFTIPGMPMLFSGQEAGLNRKLEFFEKDEIDWVTGKDYSNFFQKLIKLKKDCGPLWNTSDCGPMIKISTDKDDKIFAFIRQKNDTKVLVILNLTPYLEEFTLNIENEFNGYHDIFTDKILLSNQLGLDAWGYLVLVK